MIIFAEKYRTLLHRTFEVSEGLQLPRAAELLRQRRAALVPDGVGPEVELEGMQLVQAAELLRKRGEFKEGGRITGLKKTKPEE